jgi:creatinine amidohydrolase
MHLAETTWTEAAEAETDLAILPVGSTEQHGPNAPLSTDSLAAEVMAEAGAEAYDGEVVVAPALPYGVSEEHRAFAGTVWLSPDTFRAVVREAVESLAHHGWDRVVLVNGHGGNADALREVAAGVTRERIAYAAAFTWFDAVPPGDMGHAGPVETSVVVHHAPELVHKDRFEEAREGGTDGWGEWVSGTNLAHDSDEFTENGVVGDPSTASGERGAALTEAAAAALSELLAAVAERDLDR